MATAFEISGECNHVGAEQPGLFNCVRQTHIVITSAMFAPRHELLVFGHEKRLFDQFDLLRDFRFTFCKIKLVSAIGTSRQFELDDFIDQFRCERLAKILLVTFLSAAFPFDLAFRFLIDRRLVLRRFDDVRRRRL